jgi:molybdopterin converting factor small subunit
MIVMIPTPLRSYTEEASKVSAQGSTIADVLRDLDQRYPGIRFRMIDEQDGIRAHIRIFVNGERCHNLDSILDESDEVQILQALSGG